MGNPILEQLSQSPLNNSLPQLNNPLQNVKSLMNLVQNSRNPQMMLQNMMMQNPQMQQAMQLIQNAGGDPQKAFMELARQRGVDPNTILNQLR